MQALILAAGKGTRTSPLTLTRPKPLLKIAGKTIIEHNLTQLQGIVNEAIIVVGYLGEMILQRLGTRFGKINLSYVLQEKLEGTGNAVLSAKDKLKEKFIVMNGDDFYSKKDIEKCLKHRYCVL